MDSIRVKRIAFGSYIYLALLMSLSLGITMGFVMFLGSIVGGETKANLFGIQAEGIAAGMISIILAPIIIGIMGLFFGLLTYWPFRLVLHFMKGIQIKVERTSD